MNYFSFSEIRLIIAKSTTSNNENISYTKSRGNKPKYLSQRINLIKTLKTYVKKYCNNLDKYNVLYLSILYLDIILSKNKISLAHDKNLKYLCLCCFLISLKFIGNYNTSKKIISNFCKNYKEEYKIFEMQCLILLENNLVYTTTYDYLNLILIKEQRKLLSICNTLLYQICEDNAYIYYSPFYISVAIYQLAKTSINDDSHNHYDKYFHDERVKHLYRKFNYIINPPMQKCPPPIKTERPIINDNLNNTIVYPNLNSNTNTNINIITNSNIQNNIVIINSIPKKKSENNFNFDHSFFINKTPLKISTKGNIKQKKEFQTLNKFNDEIDFNKDEYNNMNSTIIQYDSNLDNNIIHNKINSTFIAKAKNLLSKSHYNLCRIKSSNNKYNNHKMVSIKQGDKNQNSKLNTFRLNANISANSLSYLNSLPKKKYDQSSVGSKKNLFNNKNNNKTYRKEESLSTDFQTPNQINTYNRNGKKKRTVFMNKSSVNFQLVSGVSKEELVKLSRNFSKLIIKKK
jgi:hypothetical protein